MAYSTAFTESATISAYPCYRFKDIHSAYTLGSAFYGIYLIVSYPLFAALDEPAEEEDRGARIGRRGSEKTTSVVTAPKTLQEVSLQALGAGMAVLMLLDIVRVLLGQELHIPTDRPSKTDAALTCAPFTGITC